MRMKVLLNQVLAFAVMLFFATETRSSLSAVEVTLTPSSDTSFHENVPDGNMGGNSFVSAGSNGSLSPSRALFQFDLGGIPAGATVFSAQLRLSVTGLPFSFPADSVFAL